MNKRVRWEETGMEGMDDGFEEFGPGPNAGSAPKDALSGAGGPWCTSMTNSCVTPTRVQRVDFRTCTTRNNRWFTPPLILQANQITTTVQDNS